MALASSAERAAHVPHRWRNLVTLAGVTVVGTVQTGLTTLLFPSIATTLRLTTTDLGVVAALGRIVAVPLGPAWVWLASRVGRRAVIVSATAAGGLVGAAGGWSTTFLQLLVANTVMAALVVGVAPIAQAVLADSFDDAHRSRAVGYFYGASTALVSAVGPLAALLTRSPEGWRYGLWAGGVLAVITAVVTAFVFRDPGIGAAERQLADLTADSRSRPVTMASIGSLWRVPSFAVLMGSRLLSGHLLVTVYGVQFLVTERGFDNATAAAVLLPYGLGYGIGAVAGGWLVTLLDRVSPGHGRVALLQVAQLGFAAAAYLGTQRSYASLAPYAVFTGMMGLTQALNPGANRPLVMSVVLPELRGQAFAVFFSVVDTVAWAAFTLVAGVLASRVGLTTVFWWVLVVLMVVNAGWLSLLHLTYPRDRDRVTAQLDARRATLVAP